VALAPGSHILIIGGSGFISGTLARLARDRGHKVWTLTRGNRPLPEGVTSLIADRHDTAAFERAVTGADMHWDLVVDCIGYQVADMHQDIALFRDRARNFVFVSTDYVYHPAARRFPQPEDADRYLEDSYGGNKRLCELELINADTGDMQWTIFRPCHVYGPGSLLGCWPLHGRDPDLIARLQAGEPLRLVAAGRMLIQPITAGDLSEMFLSAADNPKAHRGIFNAAGPEIIEARRFYEIIGDILGLQVKIVEVPMDEYLAEHPEMAVAMCHHLYDLSSLVRCDITLPHTSMTEGLREHVASLLGAQP